MAKRAKPKPARADHQTALRANPRPTRTSQTAGLTPASAIPSSASPAVAAVGPSLEGVSVFELAMEALQRHRYSEAATGFKSLVTRFPNERALLDRARVYLDLCERELRRQPPAPKTVEERLTAATAALNVGDERKAEKLAESVLCDEPRQDLALYLLAVIAARRDAAEAALAFLGEAIAISPEVRAQARLDGDFESLRQNERFRQLVDTSGGFGSDRGSRRARRGRAER